MKTCLIQYTSKEVTDGYMVRCTANPMATAFGRTVDEAADNLVKAVNEYLELFPEKAGELMASTRIVQVAD